MDAAGSTYLKRIILMSVLSSLACNSSLHGLERRKEQQPATSEVYAVVWELQEQAAGNPVKNQYSYHSLR